MGNKKNGFLETAKYFLKYRNTFSFSGSNIDCEILQSRSGVSSFHGFRLYDEKGHRKIETRHSETLRRLIKTKASLTFQIKQWAESRADGTLPKILFSGHSLEVVIDKDTGQPKCIEVFKEEDFNKSIVKEFNLPEWVVNAVETQKFKYYP